MAYSTKKMALLMTAFTATLALGACKKEEPKPEPEPIVDQAVTIEDIKKKYSYQDNQISPLYNVSPKEEFKVSFNSYLGDLPATEVITVHTSSDGETDSMVDITLTPETYQVGPSTFTITSAEQVLSDAKIGWGDASIYYIKINYDLDATTPTRLENPIIIPFTTVTNKEHAELKPVITDKGKFTLVIEGGEEEKTSYAVYNISRTNTSSFEKYDKSLTELSYISTYTSKISNISGREFNDWKATVPTGVLGLPKDPKALINKGVNGAYFVKVQNANELSASSNIVEVQNYAHLIPVSLKGTLNGTTHETIRSLPKTTQVQMLDGSVTDATIKYLTDGLKVVEGQPLKIPFSVTNTPYEGSLVVKTITEADLESVKMGYLDNLVSTLVLPENKTKRKPSKDLPTLISTIPDEEEELTEETTDTQKEGETPVKEGTDSKETPKDTNSKPEETKESPKDNNGSLGLGGSGITSTDGKATDAEGNPTESDEDKNLGLINKQYNYNEKLLETANKQTITLPAYIQETKYEMTYDSALEEYLAYELLAEKKTISLDAFPDAQTYDVITDALEEVIIQNPILGGISEWYYDYKTRTVNVVFNETFKPAELIQKANSILEELTMEDAKLTKKEIKKGVEPYKVKKDMTQDEVYNAIYTYLLDNTKLTSIVAYEEAKKLEEQQALVDESTKEQDKQSQDAKAPNTSTDKEPVKEPVKEEPKEANKEATKEGEQTTEEEVEPIKTQSTAYNALVQGVADDLGFAKAFKMLLDMTDIDSVVVTGMYQGKPHAWNKVNLGDQWFNTDTTLSINSVGIPNALNLANDSTAVLLGYFEDKHYWKDTQIKNLASTSNQNEYYTKNGLEVDSLPQFAQVLEKQLSAGERVVVIRTVVDLDPQSIYDTTGLVVQQTVPEHLATATFNAKGKYYIVVTHEEEEKKEDKSKDDSKDAQEGISPEENKENTENLEDLTNTDSTEKSANTDKKSDSDKSTDLEENPRDK